MAQLTKRLLLAPLISSSNLTYGKVCLIFLSITKKEINLKVKESRDGLFVSNIEEENRCFNKFSFELMTISISFEFYLKLKFLGSQKNNSFRTNEDSQRCYLNPPSS